MPEWMKNLHTIYCIGLNYHAHAKETGQEVPRYPIVFMKPKSALLASGETVHVPKVCTRGPELDYEGELGIVIGKTGKDILLTEANAHIAGICVANDFSARRWQRHAGGKQWIRGKSFDGFCALGKDLVPIADIPDPQALRIQTFVNDELKQDGNSHDMIFPIAEIIAYLSQDTTLLEGTLILTGTPAGVGVAKDPPEFLKPGAKVRVAITGVGELENTIV